MKMPFKQRYRHPRLGMVLVFKPGVTKEQVREALTALEPLMATDYFGGDGRAPIHTFDAAVGGPVWYIP